MRAPLATLVMSSATGGPGGHGSDGGGGGGGLVSVWTLVIAAVERFAIDYQLTHMTWIVVAIAALPVLYALQRALDILGTVVRIASEGATSSATAGAVLAVLAVALRYLRRAVSANDALVAQTDAALSILEDYRVLVAMALAIAIARFASLALARVLPAPRHPAHETSTTE